MASSRLVLAAALAAIAAAAGLRACAPVAGPESPVEMGASMLQLELALALLALAGALASRRRLAERLGLSRGRLPPRALAALVIGTLGLSHGLDGILTLTGLREGSALAQLDALVSDARGANVWIFALALGIAPGIAEELLCRGLVQRGLEPRFGTPAALVTAAAVFGALHVEPIHGAFAAVLGLYLGGAAALADSVRASMLCHAANNLAAVLALSFAPGLQGAASPLGIAAGFALAALGLVPALRGRARRSDPPREAPPGGAAPAQPASARPRIGRL
jgi:membrane protease YdiL (CAAX protease family)